MNTFVIKSSTDSELEIPHFTSPVCKFLVQISIITSHLYNHQIKQIRPPHTLLKKCHILTRKMISIYM